MGALMTNQCGIPLTEEYDAAVAAWKRAHGEHLKPTTDADLGWVAGYARSFVDRRLAAEPNGDVRALFNKAIGAQFENKFSFSFETTEEAERAFHYIADLGMLQTSRPPSDPYRPENTADAAPSTDSTALNRTVTYEDPRNYDDHACHRPLDPVRKDDEPGRLDRSSGPSAAQV